MCAIIQYTIMGRAHGLSKNFSLLRRQRVPVNQSARSVRYTRRRSALEFSSSSATVPGMAAPLTLGLSCKGNTKER